MSNRIRIRRSSTAGKKPSAALMEAAELAVNFSDQRLYTKDHAGNIIDLTGVKEGDSPVVGGLTPGYLSGTYAPVSDRETDVYLGAVDDFLAFAADKWIVTQTGGPAPQSGQLRDMFLEGTNGPEWELGPSDEIELAIDMQRSVNYIRTFG